MEKFFIINAGTLCGLVSLGKALIRNEIGHKPTDEELSKFSFSVGIENNVPYIEIFNFSEV